MTKRQAFAIATVILCVVAALVWVLRAEGVPAAQIAWMLLVLLGIVVMTFALAGGLAACILSSRISREEEERQIRDFLHDRRIDPRYPLVNPYPFTNQSRRKDAEKHDPDRTA